MANEESHFNPENSSSKCLSKVEKKSIFDIFQKRSSIKPHITKLTFSPLIPGENAPHLEYNEIYIYINILKTWMKNGFWGNYCSEESRVVFVWKVPGEVQGHRRERLLKQVPAEEHVEDTGHDQFYQLCRLHYLASPPLAPHILCYLDVASPHPDLLTWKTPHFHFCVFRF